MADQQPWTWPAGRVLILYHWSWFDPDIGDIVVGWSQLFWWTTSRMG